MINELDLLWVPNFIALEISFLFGTKFSWNEEIGTCFNVECALLDRNSDFLGGYLVVTHSYLKVTSGYRSLPGGYCSLPPVTARSQFYYGWKKNTFPLILRSSRSEMFFNMGVFQKFRNIHRKTPVFKSLFNEVTGLRTANFLKRDSNTGVFL